MGDMRANTAGLCVGHGCEYGLDICCRECEYRPECDEVCDGPEDGHGVDGECEFRI